MIKAIVILLALLGPNGFEKELRLYLGKIFHGYSKFDYQVLEMPKGYSAIMIDGGKESRLNKNILLIPVKIIDRSGGESSSIVSVRMKLYREVLVAKFDLNKNDPVSAEEFERELREVTSIRGTVWEDASQLAGSRAKVKIAKGTPLVREMLELIPDIKSGDAVVLHAGRNGVDVSTDAIARESGIVGDIIRVIARDKIFRARVIDKFNVILVEN